MFVTSYGNASETKANESFNNSVFFDIESKWTPSYNEQIKSAKPSELVYFKTLQYRSEANRFDSDLVFKTTKKRTFFFLNESQKTKGFDSKQSKFCHS
jgi:hypothetical protein